VTRIREYKPKKLQKKIPNHSKFKNKKIEIKRIRIKFDIKIKLNKKTNDEIEK
jgi:hypothetical protein